MEKNKITTNNNSNILQENQQIENQTKKQQIEKQYYESLQEIDKIGVQVALKIIPHVFCIERSYGYQKWCEKNNKPSL